MDTSDNSSIWPELRYSEWRETCETLHLWTQVVGKIRLEQTPWLNHSWHVPLYVTPTGLTTSPIPHGLRSFELRFDFVRHVLVVEVSDGGRREIPLRPQTVADFHAQVLQALQELHLPVRIREMPCEIAGAIPFSQDRDHCAYDAPYANRFLQVLVQIDSIFKRFRTAFLGKSSPVHFFWGSFDLAVTRFSGRSAPQFSGKVPGVAAAIMREAYSHEVSSAGFWPGGAGIDYPAFYSYAYPMPPGFQGTPVSPQGAFFSAQLGEFLLPYDIVRRSKDPQAQLLAFLQSTYEAAADASGWDRVALERKPGEAGVCPDNG